LSQVYRFESESLKHYALYISQDDQQFVKNLIETEIKGNGQYFVIAPGAAHYAKRWSEKEFSLLADKLIVQRQFKVVLVGDEEDSPVVQRIIEKMAQKAVNLCARTNLVQLAELINHCSLAIVNDSAPMHLASYLNKPVLAVFSYTDPQKYGPWSSLSHYLKKNENCPACREALIDGNHTCIDAVTHNDVLNSFKIVNGKVIFVNHERI